MGKIAKVQEVTLKKLKPYENNAKIHGAEQVEKLKASIKEFGFLTPCLIDKDFNIIAGHGRVMAAKEIGMDKVPCVFIEGLSEAQRKAYTLADNRLGELGEWDMDLVISELEELRDMDFDVSLTGFELPEDDGGGEDDEPGEFDDIEKFETHYGVPYQGNKSRIADIIISILPEGKRLVDLFGGGGAITHCAMLSDKWESFLYNDLNEMITGLFIDAVYGKYHDEHRVITREEFNDLKDTDAYVKYIWSFGNNGTGYLWGERLERFKIPACHMLMDEGLSNRRAAYRDFCKEVKGKIDYRLEPPERLQSLEQLEAIQRLEALQRLEVSNIDYRDYEYQDGDIVYCDVPYEQAGKQKCDDYGVNFNSLEFYEWVKAQPYQIYFSSYEISDKSFHKKKLKSVASLIGATTNGQKVNEYLYSNKPIEKP